MAYDKATERLLAEFLADAYGEDEQLWAFRQVLDDEAPLLMEEPVIGEAVSIIKINYGGNTHRKHGATCRKANGKTYNVALEDIEFSGEG
jgi:hypothetical protein